jgi:hypothetical protein
MFVSPSGDDSNPGTAASPLKSLAAAQAKVQMLLKVGGGITVNLRAGTYYESLVLGPADSGSQGAPVTWQAYPGEEAVLSGGQKLQCEWKPVTMNNETVYSCSLQAGQTSFPSLFINGRQMQRA